MIGKIKSIIGGNPKEVIKLKLRKTFDKNYRFNNTKINLNTKRIYNTPIIINSMNRLTFLKRQINWLEDCGLSNITIIDNQSTYTPLINYYDKIKYKIIRNQTNMGYLALWYNKIFKEIRSNHYIYTDSDIVGDDSCPKDFIEYFYECLDKIKQIDKIGFSLNLNGIDKDLDIEYKIFENENKFWSKKFQNSEVYDAPIDTTFALYRPNTYGGYWLKSGRTDHPYTANHLPWFDNKINNDEKIFYEKNIIVKNSFYQSHRNKSYK